MSIKELSVDELRDTDRILSGDNWLDTHIEKHLRDIVKALRLNGINTTSSCQHGTLEDQSCMLIDCQTFSVDFAVRTIRQIFAILKIDKYWINAHFNGNDFNAHIMIKIKKFSDIPTEDNKDGTVD